MLLRMSDPYQPPSTNPAQPVAPLYTLHGVVVATVLGSLAAAVVVVCLNYLSLGSPALARKTAISGACVYLVVIGLTALLPQSLALAAAMIVVQALLGYALANALQGTAIRYHTAQGSPLHSNLRAAGVGLLTGFAIMFFMMFVIAVVQIVTGAPTTAS